MKIEHVLLLSLILAAEHCYSQCYFYNSYDYDQKHDYGSSIIQTYDGGFLSVGNAEIRANLEESTLAVKTDSCGDVLWKSFSILSPANGSEQPNAVFENSHNHSFTLFGQQHDHSESTGSSFIFRLEASGDSFYHKIINFGIGLSDLCKYAVKNNDNEFILGGYYNTTPPNAKVFLSKVDSFGNILWKKDYGNATEGYKLKNIDKTQDGGYILSGWVNFGPNGIYETLYLLKTDSIGNQEWERRYPNTYYQGHVLATADGGYLLVGNEKIAAGIYWGYVGKMDSAGSVLWQRWYSQPNEPEVIVNAKQIPDGNFLITGTIVGANESAKTYIAKISQNNGDVIWHRTYSYFGGTSHDYLWDLIITREGDIAGNGYLIPVGVAPNTQNDMFILKIDSCGYLENDSLQAAFFIGIDTFNKTVSFTNQSIEYCTSLWYFGDGDSTYQKNPTHTYIAEGIYNVILIVRARNSTDTIQQEINLLGVGNENYVFNENSEIRILPNPANQIIHVSLPATHQAMLVIVTDLSGKTILETHETTIPLYSVSKGLYFVTVHLANGQSVVRKVVVV